MFSIRKIMAKPVDIAPECRREYKKDQATNLLKTTAKQAAVVSVSAGAVALTANSKKVEQAVVWAAKKAGSLIAKSKLLTKAADGASKLAKNIFSEKLVSKFKTSTPAVKFAAVLAVPVLAAAAKIGVKGIYKAGQINQEYKDITEFLKMASTMKRTEQAAENIED